MPWLNCCKLGSDAVAIDTVLDPRPNEAVIVKKFPSAFFETDLQDRLHALGVDTIVLAGCTTSVCVRATAVDAMQRNFHTLVAAEAVGDLDAALHAVHLRDLDARYADVMSVDDLLAYFHSLPLPSNSNQSERSKVATMDLNLRGRSALITGASKGIGRAIATVLAEEGCNLILVSRTAADLDAAKEKLRNTGVSVVTHALDVSSTASIDQTRRRASRHRYPGQQCGRHSGRPP